MKRIILLSLTLLLSFTGVLYAVGVNGTFDGYDIVRVKYKGAEMKVKDTPAVNLNGRTMIPLYMAEELGFTLKWDNTTKTANITEKQELDPNRRILSREEIQSLDKAVAYITVLDDKGVAYRQGSGFIINSKGMLITCYHVAEEGGKLRAMKVEVNGKTYNVPAGKYLFADQEKDIYGVYLDGVDFPYLKVNTALPEKQATLWAIGNPEGQRNVVTTGDLSFVTGYKIFTHLITKPGFSGAPTLNEYGEVIGVVSGADEEKINVSIAMSEVKELYDQSFNR